MHLHQCFEVIVVITFKTKWFHFVALTLLCIFSCPGHPNLPVDAPSSAPVSPRAPSSGRKGNIKPSSFDSCGILLPQFSTDF